MTKQEKQDEAAAEKLDSLCRQYRKYFVTVYLSGGLDLAEETSILLCRSRKRLAEQEARRQRG